MTYCLDSRSHRDQGGIGHGSSVAAHVQVLASLRNPIFCVNNFYLNCFQPNAALVCYLERCLLVLFDGNDQVWDWMAARGPSRLWRSHGVDTCLLYHARLWGRTLAELRVASGTVFNQARDF